MFRSRDEMLDTIHRLQNNPATAHLIVRATKKGRRPPQERLLGHVVKESVAVLEEDIPEETQVPDAAEPGVADAPMRWMRLNDVKKYIRLSAATIYRMINEQGFPRPKKLGQSSIWDREEIDSYMEGLPAMVIPRLDWVDGKKPRAKKMPEQG